MTPKQYLDQAKWLDEKINGNLELVVRLREQFFSAPNYSKIGGKNSAPSDRVADTVVKIVELEKRINDETDALIALKRDIYEKISAIENSRYRLVLQERYLSFKDWKEIAKVVKCTEKHISRLHGFALVAFQKKYADVLQCP